MSAPPPPPPPEKTDAPPPPPPARPNIPSPNVQLLGDSDLGVEPRVKWKEGERETVDKPCAICFLIACMLFLACGIAILASSHAIYSYDDDGNVNGIGPCTVH